MDLALDSVLEPEKLRARMGKPYRTLKSLMIMCLRSRVSMTDVASAPLKNILKYVGTVRVADLSPFESKRELRETVDLASLPGELYLCGDEKSLRRDYEALLKLEEEGFEYLFGREELMLDEPRAALRRGCEERQILRGGGKNGVDLDDRGPRQSVAGNRSGGRASHKRRCTRDAPRTLDAAARLRPDRRRKLRRYGKVDTRVTGAVPDRLPQN